jgi:hypothetical protein
MGLFIKIELLLFIMLLPNETLSMSISHPADMIRQVEREQKFSELVESYKEERLKINQQLIDMSQFPIDKKMYNRLIQRIQEIDREIESHRPLC